MPTNTEIKRKIENLESDILFEKYLGDWVNDSIIYEPKGIFNKEILHDIQRATTKRKHLHLEISRPGLYDVLPKGLFHNKVDDKNNKDSFFEHIENQRKSIRRFFLPFDSLIFKGIADIEKENLKHYKSSFDTDILISFFDFFHLNEFLDFQTVLELLAIDMVSFTEAHKINYEVIGARLNKILNQEISSYQLVRLIFNILQGNSILVRFIRILPFVSSEAGKISSIEQLLGYLLEKNIKIKRLIRQVKLKHDADYHRISDNSSMNRDSKSIILGNSYCNNETFVLVEIDLEGKNQFLARSIMHGALHYLLEVFFSFFLNYTEEFEVKIKFRDRIHEKSDSLFFIDSGNLNNIDKLSELRKKLIKLSPSGQYQSTQANKVLPLSAIILLKEYFLLFLKIIMEEKVQYAFLNMNTKI